ncbi:SRPBCC family protein [Actinoplanes sp. HUAS TT8]|uniref:SRPBCC family protein n=1 Tax=Actinoplanes sp. HUAS TT8 TaxID=3447453 RepID=UPI003F528C01
MIEPQASVVADGDRWTLIFIRELRQPPAEVWPALVDPARLDRWAPFSASRPLTEPGEATLTMVDGEERTALPAVVHRVEAPHLLEYSWGEDLLRWELTPSGTGTRLTLRHTLTDRDMDAMVAAGWHLCADVLQRLLDGEDVAAIRGRDAMNHGWESLRDRYAAAFIRI